MTLKTNPLSPCNQLLDPAWFNRVRQGQHAAVVAADGATVLLYGEALRLREDTLPPGTAVQAWLGSRFFVCATLEEIEREAQARREAAAAEAERQRQRLDALRAEAEAFNARIALPVAWDVGIKDVLSGLSATSWGDGRSRATVEHILLLKPLWAGRLQRETGDFLCTASGGSNGKRWSHQQSERFLDGGGQGYRPKVTCRACLALAQRWTKASTHDAQ